MALILDICVASNPVYLEEEKQVGLPQNIAEVWSLICCFGGQHNFETCLYICCLFLDLLYLVRCMTRFFCDWCFVLRQFICYILGGKCIK